MKKDSTFTLGLLCLLTFASVMRAAVVTVTTTNNISPAIGETNLAQAIIIANTNGAPTNTINFNLLGSPGQIFYLETPPGGYPIVTNHNVTIDGYSQPGATPNTNSIHGSNTAQIKICLDSRNENGTDMGAHTNFIGAASLPGFAHDEWAVLGVFRGTNVHIKGLAILSAPQNTAAAATIKSISFARDHVGNCANWHVSGCWIGVDPADGQIKYLSDGTTVAAPKVAIAAYRHRDASGNNPVYPQPGTIGVAAGSSNPRAEFNVIVNGFGFDAEGLNFRVAGNFWGVLPDGLTNADFSVLNGGAQMGDGFIEIGRDGSNCTIGTDGDGVNDADEGNLFGAFGNGGSIVNFYVNSSVAAPQNNVVIAGNSVGVAIDGTTRFPSNKVTFVNSFDGRSKARIGSDFDGVSDALEGNVIDNNYPFASLFPNPTTTLEPRLLVIDPGARVSFRGNVTVNNDLIPFDYADGSGGRLVNFTNYEQFYLDTTSSNGLIPNLSASNIYPTLSGTFAPGIAPYTNIIIDVYQLDPEGWTNGMLFELPELTNSITTNSFDGFAQGKKYLGSRPVANTGSFNINATGLDFGTNGVTVTANYSADPVGTHNGRVQTSNFSTPSYPITPLIIAATKAGGNLIISWNATFGSFTLQSTPTVSPAAWANVVPQPLIVPVGGRNTMTVAIGSGNLFFRLSD